MRPSRTKIKCRYDFWKFLVLLSLMIIWWSWSSSCKGSVKHQSCGIRLSQHCLVVLGFNADSTQRVFHEQVKSRSDLILSITLMTFYYLCLQNRYNKWGWDWVTNWRLLIWGSVVTFLVLRLKVNWAASSCRSLTTAGASSIRESFPTASRRRCHYRWRICYMKSGRRRQTPRRSKWRMYRTVNF